MSGPAVIAHPAPGGLYRLTGPDARRAAMYAHGGFPRGRAVFIPAASLPDVEAWCQSHHLFAVVRGGWPKENPRESLSA